MKQIYKREPIQHNLPANYAKLDAVNYLNLNGFKGLQVYDNPLIADQNSTYSCKNIYVDEHGNLTVRPALVPSTEASDILWKHVFADGKELTITKNLTMNTWVTTKPVRSLSVVPFETNDKKYIFLQDETRNTLYDITNGEFTIVDGVVLLDDPAKTDVSHYNILNNKVLYEYAGRNFGENRPSTDYNITYMVPFVIDWDKPYKIQPLSENTLIIAGYCKIIIVHNKQFITLTVDTGYQRNSNDWCIEFVDNLIDITVAGLDDNPINSDDIPADNSVGAYFKPGKVKRFIISLSGEIISEYTAIIAGAGLFAGYGYAIALSMTGGSTDEYGNSSYELYARELSENFEFWSNGQMAVDWTEIELPVNLYPVIRYKTSYRTKIGYYGCVVAFAGGLAYIQRQYNVSAQLHKIYYYTYNGTKLDDSSYVSKPASAEGTELKFYSIFNDIILSERNHLYFHEQGFSDTTYDKIIEILNAESGITSIIDTETKLKYPASALSYFAVYSKHGNSVFEHEYLSNTSTEYSFDEPVIFATDTTVITSTATLIQRIPKLLSTILERDQSIIPVLSNINEPVVTGFFLDNCWWFITEHSIFGTGTDGNGLQTPERFDPLKYFNVSEKITGAMRISDTSFWVFHSNGAYLIYKTSLALSEGTEYRWLYTTTAKSKGCDFENALHTLPVSSNIVTVTASDICNAALRENVQSDERTLVPMTTQFAVLMRELLLQTESVKIFDHQYLTIFCLNPVKPNGIVPAVVHDNVSATWWYWEFPVNKVHSIRELEEYSLLYCELSDGTVKSFKLSDDEYYHQRGMLRYLVYADRLDNQSTEPTQIEWHWQSAVQLFGTVEYRKQLLFTIFVFDDYAENEFSEQEIEIGYYFDIYSREYATSKPDATTASVYRVSNKACRTTIGSFNYLQLNLHNREFENTNFEVLTKPKICCISMKYRILRGEV